MMNQMVTCAHTMSNIFRTWLNTAQASYTFSPPRTTTQFLISFFFVYLCVCKIVLCDPWKKTRVWCARARVCVCIIFALIHFYFFFFFVFLSLHHDGPCMCVCVFLYGTTQKTHDGERVLTLSVVCGA